jgi:acyl-coenzyme A synthetase/AMP-(fatty) acid ligase
MDNQIKHLGYRIELGEIEHVVSNTFDNLQACVLYDEESRKIVMFYESSIEIRPLEFRKTLSKFLSKYMIPSEFIHLDKMPYNTSGKIDRKLLKKRYPRVELV